jgi:hypothetical protein
VRTQEHENRIAGHLGVLELWWFKDQRSIDVLADLMARSAKNAAKSAEVLLQQGPLPALAHVPVGDREGVYREGIVIAARLCPALKRFDLNFFDLLERAAAITLRP